MPKLERRSTIEPRPAMTRLLFMAAALALSAACGDDATKVGYRGECASPAGSLAPCATELESPEDVCLRLVDCGTIPLDHADSRDWNDCVERLLDYDTIRFEYTRDCVAASSCDELAPQQDGFWPLCFRFGRQ